MLTALLVHLCFTNSHNNNNNNNNIAYILLEINRRCSNKVKMLTRIINKTLKN